MVWKSSRYQIRSWKQFGLLGKRRKVGREGTTQFRKYLLISPNSPQNRSNPGNGSHCSLETPFVPKEKPPVIRGQPGTPPLRDGRSLRCQHMFQNPRSTPPTLLSHLLWILRPLSKTHGVNKDAYLSWHWGSLEPSSPVWVSEPPPPLFLTAPPRSVTQRGAESVSGKLGCPPSRRERRVAAPRVSRLARVSPTGAGAGSHPLPAITIRYLRR